MKYVALLRGVNVGGRGRLPMATLREVVESLGYTDVQTFIQSGNVVFSSPRRVTAAAIETALEREVGIPFPVVLRTAADLQQVVDQNPFPRAQATALHVGFMAAKPPTALVRDLDTDRYAPEEVAVIGRELYFHLPSGMGSSKLAPYVGRKLAVPATVRNWATVNKLLELAST